MESNSENRNSNISTRRFSTRRCLFCKTPGHNINNCDNYQLRDFHALCRYKIEFSKRYYSLPRRILQNWLSDYSLQNSLLIKAFASSYLRICIRNLNIADIVHEIYNYYCLTYSIPFRNDNLFEDMEPIYHSNEVIYQSNEVMETTHQLNEDNIQNNKRFNITIKIIENSGYFINENECFICYEKNSINKFIKLNCNHEFCKDCIKKQIKSTITENVHCALCRNIVDNIEIRDNEILEEIINEVM
jgi:hypothetical protein